ncbi:MAG: mechanosensitive ion channel family protein [Chloroflexi bacterium]|nr:mechanosensitive ion channel family protein [Chloroflexota bacterium]
MTVTPPPILMTGQTPHVIAALVVAVAAIVLAARLRQGTIRIAQRGSRIDASVALLLGRVAFTTVLVIAAIWILIIFNIRVVSVLTVFGVVGLAVSLALQDVLRNLFSGIYLLIERPFTIGDYLELLGTGGTVENIELRLTSLRTLEGTRLTIPNSTVFNAIVTNRTVSAYRCWTLYVTLPPDLVDLQQITTTVAAVAHSLDDLTPHPNVVLETVSSKGAILAVDVWGPPRRGPSHIVAALHQQLPRAIIALPGAPIIPDMSAFAPAKPPAPTPSRTRSGGGRQQ